ncbi:MAG: NAD(P)/FAD-dependent oxidoreductase [Methanobacteriota archaeon]|nr:MAG: NAD(P)/FAD-dependent oxidoreductase [Euryarchaeota archaeon]
MTHFDLISIGSGSSGRKIAVGLKRAGWNTAIVEADVDHHFGGTCINTGCIPTKAIVEVSNTVREFKTAMELKNKIVERIHSGTLRNAREKVGTTVINGFAKFVDSHTIEVNGEKYTADYIVIATGSEPAIPPIKGLSEVSYKTSKDTLDLNHLPEHMLIIGGGRIGLEFGQAFHNLGVKVSVFEGLPHLLPGEDEEMADAIKAHLVEQGISIYTGKFVDEVRESKANGKTTYTVVLKDGPNAGEYEGDYLLVATGRVPRTSGLNLEAAGVETNRRAVVINEFMQTSQPHIFAVGDVTGNPMFTNWAAWQAGVVLNNLKKNKTKSDQWEPLRMPHIPRLTFTHPELASTGLTEKEAKEKYGEENVVVVKFYNKWLGKSMIVGDWTGFLKGIGLKGSNEILGVHLWGIRTASLLQMVILAMDNGLGWKELANMVYGHPILAEGIESLSKMMLGKVFSQ